LASSTHQPVNFSDICVATARAIARLHKPGQLRAFEDRNPPDLIREAEKASGRGGGDDKINCAATEIGGRTADRGRSARPS